MGDAMKGVAWLTGTAITILNLMTWVVFIFLTILLDPLFFSLNEGNAFVEMLNQVWILSRDLMNIAFALILIGAAVYTIVTANKELVTSHLKTFVLSVVLINFSWFIPRIIIDVGNIAAATIYGIPSLVHQEGLEDCKFNSSRDVPGLSCTPIPDQEDSFSCPCGMVADARFFLDTPEYEAIKRCNDDDPNNNGGCLIWENINGWHCPLGPVMCVQMQRLTNDVANHSAILNGLIVNHARLQGLAMLPKSTGQSTNSQMIIFVVQEAIVVFMHVALLFPLLAILIAFAIRIPVLWLTVAFMPFLFLKYVLPSQYTTEYPEKLMENFLKAAFLPALVAIPFAIGFLLVNAGANMMGVALDWERLNFIKLDVGSVSTLWQLLWYLITIGVIWVGVFAVLDKVGIMGMGSQAIKSVGESLGRLAVKAPFSLPIIPGPLGSVTPLSQFKKLDPRKIEYQLDNNPKGLGQYIEDARAGRAPGGGINPAQHTQRAEEMAKNNEQLVKLNESIKTLNTDFAGMNDGERMNKIKEIASTHNIELDISSPEKAEVSLRHFYDKMAVQKDVNQTELAALKQGVDGLRDHISRSKAAVPPPNAAQPNPPNPAPNP